MSINNNLQPEPDRNNTPYYGVLRDLVREVFGPNSNIDLGIKQNNVVSKDIKMMETFNVLMYKRQVTLSLSTRNSSYPLKFDAYFPGVKLVIIDGASNGSKGYEKVTKTFYAAKFEDFFYWMQGNYPDYFKKREQREIKN